MVSAVEVVGIASHTNAGPEEVVGSIIIVSIKIPLVIKGTEGTVEFKDVDPPDQITPLRVKTITVVRRGEILEELSIYIIIRDNDLV